MLETSLRKFRKNIYLSRGVLKSCQDSDDPKSKLAGQMAIVSLQDSWSKYIRSLVYFSSTGTARTTSGTNITCTPPVQNEAEFLARLGLSPNDREPDWHVADIAIRKLKTLNPSNYSSLSANLGSIISPEKFMRDYRNFVVHKYRNTADKLMRNSEFVRLGYTGNLSDLIFEVMSGGNRVYEDWLRRFEIIATISARDP